MKKIITIGGGTGSFTVLSGIKNIPDIEIGAIVSMADDGGSTGVLRDELGVLPPGDIRQCLVALSSHSEALRSLVSYRFTEGTLAGHSFGNILLAALEKSSGSFVAGVEIASQILKIKGRVIPVTENKATLCLLLKNGQVVEGEANINFFDVQSSGAGIEKFFYKEKVELSKTAREAIDEADCVIICPGNFYCSIIPNLIVEGFSGALRNSKAKIIVPVNLTNKKGHTLGWGVKKYIEEIEKMIERNIDFILINNELPSKEQVEKYKLQEGDGVLVENDLTNDNRVLEGNFLSHNTFEGCAGDGIASTRSIIRHDGEALARTVEHIILK